MPIDLSLVALKMAQDFHGSCLALCSAALPFTTLRAANRSGLAQDKRGRRGFLLLQVLILLWLRQPRATLLAMP